MWSEMRRALKHESDQIIELHQMLCKLDSVEPAAMLGRKNDFYNMPGFEPKESKGMNRIKSAKNAGPIKRTST